MATAKRKCAYCRERFPREGMVITNTLAFCTMDHAIAYAKEKAPKVRKRQERERKREFQKNDLRIRKAAAKEACHAYIRERDRDKPCICCGKALGNGFHAGHWLESGNNPFTRYDERNIHGQRIDCNYFRGGDSGDYERNLRSRIGDAEVDALLALRGGTLKRTAEDYLKIETYYKRKLQELRNERENG